MALARHYLTAGTGTAVSRLLGFVRDMLLAALLGSGPIADAFVVAFRLPNLFRRLLSEGALNAAFVPIYARAEREGGAEGAARFAGDALTSFTLVLLVLTAVCEIGMGVVVWMMAPGFAGDAAKFGLTVDLSRIAFPFLALATMAALFAGLLNAAHRFAMVAFAPVAFNVVLVGILVAAFFLKADGPGVAAFLAGGVVVAGAVQLLLCIVAVRRAGIGVTLRAPRRTPEVSALMTLALPGLFAGGIAQINAFVGTIVASTSPSAVSFLYYADRVYQLPLGIVGVAIGLVLLPELSKRLASDDAAGVADSQDRAIEFALALSLPAAIALGLLAFPIVDVLFRHGAFGETASLETARTLAAFAIGLPGYVLAKALQPAFFARGDLRTPTLVAAFGAALDVALAVLLFGVLSQVGVALAASAAGWFNALALGVLLVMRGWHRPSGATLRRVAMMIVASLVMGLFVWAALHVVEPLWSGGLALRATVLAALCLSGFALYVGTAHAVGAFDLAALRRALKRA